MCKTRDSLLKSSFDLYFVYLIRYIVLSKGASYRKSGSAISAHTRWWAVTPAAGFRSHVPERTVIFKSTMSGGTLIVPERTVIFKSTMSDLLCKANCIQHKTTQTQHVSHLPSSVVSFFINSFHSHLSLFDVPPTRPTYARGKRKRTI